MRTNSESRPLGSARPAVRAVARVVVAAVLTASASACRERPGKLELEQDEHFGRAWYQRDGDGWRVDDVSISDDARDHMWRVTY